MRKKPLLSNVLEELKEYKEGALLDKTILIYDEDDNSEIETSELRSLSSEKFKSFKVIHYYQLIFNPSIIEIYVEKIKNSEH